MNLLEVNSLAEQYAARYNPGRVAPFPYENILKEHDDLEIFFLPLDDDQVSGATLFKDDKYNILVNSNKPDTRQHFTLGHELAHYFLHKDLLQQENGLIDQDHELDSTNILYRSDDDKHNQIEREANHFAASLLMPADLVRRAWSATGNIERAAQIFQVSTVAMAVRLAELGLVQ